MDRRSVFTLATAATAFALALPQSAVAKTAGDREAVVTALDRWDRAWAVKDPTLGAADYAEDADWVNAFGMRRKGRAAIEATLREVFALPFVAAGVSETKGHDVRFLADDLAVVITSVQRRGQKTPSGEELGVRRTTHQRVFEKRAGKWMIVSHLISDARDTERRGH